MMAGRDASAPEGRHDAGNLVRRRLRADLPRFSFRPIPDDDYPVDACGQTGRRGLASGLRLLKSSRLRAGPAGGTCGSHRLRAGPAGRIACGRGLRAASPAGGTCRSHRLRAGPSEPVALPAGGTCRSHRLRAGPAEPVALPAGGTLPCRMGVCSNATPSQHWSKVSWCGLQRCSPARHGLCIACWVFAAIATPAAHWSLASPAWVLATPSQHRSASVEAGPVYQAER